MRPIFIRKKLTPQGFRLFASHDSKRDEKGKVSLILDGNAEQRFALAAIDAIGRAAKAARDARPDLGRYAAMLKGELESRLRVEVIALPANSLAGERIMLKPVAGA